jgi:hypothetical protein
MGIDIDVAKFILSARDKGVSFRKTLMLGNQQFQIGKNQFAKLSQLFGLKNFEKQANSIEFFHYLDAEEVSSMDISDYENAAILHDLNNPIEKDLYEKFSFVLDGGTLEHIFNFPVALENAMKLVEVGGHLMIITGGNNFMGHGFYQFSPELFYRCLSPENGFTVERLVAAEVGGNWFEAADPKEIKGRVELVNEKQTYLMVLAKKMAKRPIFETTPQQSDYVEMWQSSDPSGKAKTSANSIKNLIKRNEFLYENLVKVKQNQINKTLLKEKSFANVKAFKPVEK